MLLGEVFKNINKKYKNIYFKNIRFNSKECKLNDIFFAIRGNNYDGNKYIYDAINNGAKIIVSSSKSQISYKKKVLFIYNKNPRKMLSDISSRFYKLKPKNIIAVTVTYGKTSIAYFYLQIMSLNNKKVASIGTLGVLSKKFNLETTNTTIDPVNIHKILQRLKKLGVDNVIIEASSHGLKQHRMDNINFNHNIHKFVKGSSRLS